MIFETRDNGLRALRAQLAKIILLHQTLEGFAATDVIGTFAQGDDAMADRDPIEEGLLQRNA